MPPSRARALLLADLALGLGGASAAGVSEALKECWETGAELAGLLVERGVLDAGGRAKRPDPRPGDNLRRPDARWAMTAPVSCEDRC